MDPTTNVLHISVRLQGRITGGGSLYIQYTGVIKVDEATSKVITWSSDAKTTDFGDHDFWVRPVVETSNQEHKWLETTFFVGQGRWVVEKDAPPLST